MIGFKRSTKFKFLRMFCQYEIYSCFIELTKLFAIAISYKLGLKSRSLNIHYMRVEAVFAITAGVSRMTLKKLV